MRIDERDEFPSRAFAEVRSVPSPSLPTPPSEKVHFEPIGYADFYHTIRGQIEHEDNLASTRLNWFITSQSFLFTAYAITVGNASALPPADRMATAKATLLLLIPVVALSTSALIALPIAGGVLAMRNLRRFAQPTLDRARREGYPLPPIQGARFTQSLGLTAPLILPVLFSIVWLLLLMICSRAPR